MATEKTSPLQVNDRPAELWIKVLSLVAAITLPLIGVIGGLLIDGQYKLTEEVSKLNSFLQTHESRISRNERDIQELEAFYRGINQKGE